MTKDAATKPLTFKLFLEFIRLNAKTASAIPFILGLLYASYYFKSVDWLNSLIYFVAQMAIAFFVTGFNNVQDYKLAIDQHYRDTYNIIGREHLSPRRMLNLMLAFLVLACSLGLVLVWRTNLLLLFMGGAGIFITIFYTYGPIPFSRFPLGEILSGVAEGFGVFFITIYVNVAPQQLLGLFFDWPRFMVTGNLVTILILILVGLPNIFTVGNLMFADNMSDLQQDIRNQRFTLPYYLGIKHALTVYTWVLYLCFVSVTAGVILRVLPPESLLVWLTLPKLRKNIRIFKQRQIKESTFETAIQNLMLFQGVQIVALLLAILRTQVFS
ncbi:UbiA family prenyltransferase [Loigolactobacillus zhaoyuanensis]|uniref:UbiA family prenyltransferase n=1 Tax=Loigolactobacillus zhaoyuanensis TaxID=2486017 RepID=A0ABW8UG63_9LACO|nr:UbiA family prenyltransferase [Loigolactobacillus zhaoyuanensis]